MRRRFSLLSGLLLLTFSLHAALPSDQPPLLQSKDSTDANIAEITAEMLQTWHYSQHPFDQEIAGKMLDRYLDTLDYYHTYFLQSDIAEFAPYRTNLNVLTLTNHDMSPCWLIFSRFMQRASQHVNAATNWLATDKFDFTAHQRYVVNRHTLPYPKDLAEAKEFWHQELRSEYLEQLLIGKDIEFTGTAAFDAKDRPVISLARDKTHPLAFDYLPAQFLSKNGSALGSLKVSANGSNATVNLELKEDGNWKTGSNSFFAASGAKIGDIHFHSNSNNYTAFIHLDEKNLAEINKSLTNHYVQLLKNFKELDSDRVFEMYMNSLAHAYDPHSDYMGHLQAENFAIQMKLSLFGIGAVLQKEDQYCKIAELKEGPAMKSGKVKTDDRIVAVAQTNAEPVDVIGMPLDKIVEMIRGPKGSQVTLTILPADAPDSSVRKEVTLVRDEIKLEDSAAKARLYELPAVSSPKGKTLHLGLIDIPSFYADNDRPTMNTSSDVARLIGRLEKENVDGIIIDLRRNGGGFLEEAIKLTGLFVPKGPVVQTKDPNGEIVTDSCSDPAALYKGPLILLTSVFSASASEILAGALQDYGRALIVGDHATFGKGTVQTMQPLAPYMEQKHMEFSYNPGSLKPTIKKFYRAGGVSTQLQGVLSDIELPSILTQADFGERSMPNALPCDSVPSADPEQMNEVKPYLAELQGRSHQRIDKDKDFDYIREDIAEYQKQQADKSISLNETERVVEQKSLKARAAARKKERLARKKSDEKVFEITLKNVDEAALQPPTVKTNALVAVKETGLEEDLDSSDSETIKEETGSIDPTLAETKRILVDYIALLKKGPSIARDPSGLSRSSSQAEADAHAVTQ